MYLISLEEDERNIVIGIGEGYRYHRRYEEG